MRVIGSFKYIWTLKGRQVVSTMIQIVCSCGESFSHRADHRWWVGCPKCWKHQNDLMMITGIENKLDFPLGE